MNKPLAAAVQETSTPVDGEEDTSLEEDQILLEDDDAEEKAENALMEELFPGLAESEEPEVEITEEAEEVIAEETQAEQEALDAKKTEEAEAAQPPEDKTKETAQEEQPTPEEPAPEQPPVQETQEDFEARLHKFNADAEQLLSEQVYNMSAEQVEELETDPAAAMPKLAAHLHMQVMRATTQNIARLLPTLMENIQAQQKVSSGFTNQFFETHPTLSDHQDTVIKYGQVYRKLNPDATPEEFIRDVGAQVSVALGLHAQPVQEQPAPAVPAAPAPFTPSAARKSSGAVPKQQPTNEFELMAEEELAENS